MIAFRKTNDGFSATVSGRGYCVPNTHEHYKELIACLHSNNEDVFLQLVDRKKTIEDFTSGKVSIKNGEVYFNGKVIHDSMTRKILELKETGFPFENLVNFLVNIENNPSARARNEGYDFLEHKNLPITTDGCFLAYKAVRNDFRDKYSGTFDNSVGKIVEVPRNTVDDNRDNECSYGLHVGCLEYSGPGGAYYSDGDKVIVVKVNPADIVSVPKDYNATKMRVCKYEVVSEYTSPMTTPVYTQNNVPAIPKQHVNVNVVKGQYSGEPVDVPKIGDEITFMYKNEKRYLDVEKVKYLNDDEKSKVVKNIEGTLLKEDKKYDVDECFRNFKYNLMSDIRVLN